jgi:hypothetical protein
MLENTDLAYVIAPREDFEFEEKLPPNPLKNYKVVEKTHGCLGVCLDGNNSRTWVKTGEDNQHFTNLPVFEVISGKTVFIVDFDDKQKIPQEEFWELMNKFKKRFAKFFMGFYECEQKMIFSFLATSNVEYNSAHMYILIYDEKQLWVTKSLKSQGYFFFKFLQKYPQYKEFLDLSMYCEEKQLRIVGSPQENKGVHMPSKNTIVSLHEGQPYVLKSPVTWFRASVKGGDVYVIEEKKVEYTNKPHTLYEKVKIQEMIMGSMNIDKYYVWRKACSLIFYFTRSVETVTAFCSRNGWGKPEHVKENQLLCETFKDERNISYRTYLDFFVLSQNKKVINKVCYDDPARVIVMKSGCGTGKTVAFFEKFKTEKILVISYRISLADQLVAKYGITSYQNVKEGDKPDRLVCTVESLWKFSDIIDHYDILFIDEITAVCNQFHHAFKQNPKQFHRINSIFKYFLKKKKVILASANIGLETINFLKYFKVRDYVFYENTEKTKTGYSYTFVDFQRLENEILAVKDKNIAIACNNLKMVDHFQTLLEKFGTVLVQTSKDKRVPVSEWKNYQFLIYSPSIECGVSFEEDHFDYIFGYFKHFANNCMSCFQMLFRVRAPRNKRFFLFAAPETEDMDRNEVEIKQRLQLLALKNASLKDRTEFSDKKFNIEDYDLPLHRVIVDCEQYNWYSNSCLKKLLGYELQYAGFAKSFAEPSQTKKREPNYKNFNAKTIKVLFGKEIEVREQKKLEIMKIENVEETEGVFDNKKNIYTQIERLFRGFTLRTTESYSDMTAIICLKFIDKFEPTEKYFNEFYKEYCDTLKANFNSSTNHSIEAFCAKKMQYKVQIMNGKLDHVCHLIRKNARGEYEVVESPGLQKVRENYKKKMCV